MASTKLKTLVSEYTKRKDCDPEDYRFILQVGKLIEGADFNLDQKVQEEAEDAHALFSPSAAKRWLSCSGSLEMAEGLEDTTSPAAEEGTYFHNLMEELYNGEDFYAVLKKARDTNMEDAIEFTAQTVNDFPEKVFLAEHRVWLTEHCWGTADLILWDSLNKSLRIVDFKYGFYPVSADENPQLLIYASAVFQLWKQLGVVPKIIKGTIIQPRLKTQEEKVKTAIFRKAELNNIRHKVQEAERIHFEGNGSLRPGKHCKFCKAIPICPAYNKARTEENASFFGQSFTYQAYKMPLEEVSEQLAYLQDNDNWRRSATEHLRQKLAEGETVSFHRLSDNGRMYRK